MATNFLDTVKGYFPSGFSNQASSSLNESESGISKAMSALIPAGLAGILGKATSGSDGANSVFNMAKRAKDLLSGTPDVNFVSSDPESGNIVSSLFGGNHSKISDMISNFANIKSASVAALLATVVPSIMGLLGKHSDQNNLNADGLSGFLASQKDHIMNAMPPGLSSLAGMFGMGAMGNAASSATSSATTGAKNTVNNVNDKFNVVKDEKVGGPKWLAPVIIILLVIAAIWYFMSKGCNKTVENSPVMDTVSAVNTVPPVDTVTTTTMEIYKVTLPNGKELNAKKGGIEDQLVTFLKSDWKSMSDADLKAKWFNFDNLNFVTGMATLVPESEQQLDNIAEILKAFPDAKIKIGGYTDASGDSATNKKLSQERADAAKNGLAKRGVGGQITGAEGYGSSMAKYPATASDAERESDRHVSVSVRK